MRCSSCGARIGISDEQCMECCTDPTKIQTVVAPESAAQSSSSIEARLETTASQQSDAQTSKLIAFPGVSRSSLPQWRKDLSERVREVQEKRAREDASEANEKGWPAKEDQNQKTPQLELLPQAESGPVNPLVAAALRRIERAHEPDAPYVRQANNMAHAPAIAYAAPPEFREEAPPVCNVAGIESSRGPEAPSENDITVEPELLAEKARNLVVVPTRVINTESLEPKPKPRRMIAGDSNDPALNYLDSVLTTVQVQPRGYRRASLFSRLLGALVDLLLVCLMCAPFAAALELTSVNWQDARVTIVIVALFAIVSFLYFTISTALTGRTLGMRLLSLRIVDARTGLIPTGKQSAGRSIIYLVSLLTLGFATLYALFDSERRTAHDRLTKTVVVHL